MSTTTAPVSSLSLIAIGATARFAAALSADKPIEIGISPQTQNRSRLLAEVTFQKAERTCPDCGSRAVSKMANSKDYRCSQCSKQFRISEQPEDQVYVIGVADDANDVVVRFNKEQTDPAKKLVESAQPFNTWKKVATAEIEPGVITEFWAATGTKPVGKIVIRVNKPAQFKQPISVAVLFSELTILQPAVPKVPAAKQPEDGAGTGEAKG
jgi:DNA-directed RNA polymerase subunit RPC12/RpoP